MDKEEVVHVHNGILAMENNEPLLFEAPQMSLQIIMKDEVSWKNVIQNFKGVDELFNMPLHFIETVLLNSICCIIFF